jgi:hypothetical protein
LADAGADEADEADEDEGNAISAAAKSCSAVSKMLFEIAAAIAQADAAQRARRCKMRFA